MMMEGESAGESQSRSTLRSRIKTIRTPLSDRTNTISVSDSQSAPKPYSQPPASDADPLPHGKQTADRGKGKERAVNAIAGNKRKGYEDLGLLEPHTVPPTKIHFDGEVERRELTVMEGEAGQSQRRSTLRSSDKSRSRMNRNPLSDCTNTIFKSQSQSSLAIVAATGPEPEPCSQSKTQPDPTASAAATSPSGSAANSADPSTPPLSRPSSRLGRQTADRGKGKEKVPAVPFSTYSVNRVVSAITGNKIKEYEDLGLLEPYTVPPKKINFDEVERRNLTVIEGEAGQSQRRSTLRSNDRSRSRMNRSPLSDCTNTIIKSQPQSSLAIVVATRPEPKPCSQSITQPNPTASAAAAAPSGSAANSADPSTPLPPSRPSSPPGGDDNYVFEICTVYTRRQTADKRKGKQKALPVHFSSYSADRILNAGTRITEYDDIGLPDPPHTVPLKKKQRSEQIKQDASEQSLQDYIQQQKAYFDEVDAFELPEEEVSGDDLD